MSPQTRSRVILTLIIVFLCGGTVVAVRSIRNRNKSEVAAKELYDKLHGPNASNLTREERGQLWNKVGDLSQQQKEEFFHLMHKSEMETINQYYALPKGERERILDEDLKRRPWIGFSRSSRRGSGTAQQFQSTRPRSSEGFSGFSGSTRRESNTDWDRIAEDYLARTTPEERAKKEDYYRQARARAEQLRQLRATGRQ